MVKQADLQALSDAATRLDELLGNVRTGIKMAIGLAKSEKNPAEWRVRYLSDLRDEIDAYRAASPSPDTDRPLSNLTSTDKPSPDTDAGLDVERLARALPGAETTITTESGVTLPALVLVGSRESVATAMLENLRYARLTSEKGQPEPPCPDCGPYSPCPRHDR